MLTETKDQLESLLKSVLVGLKPNFHWP